MEEAKYSYNLKFNLNGFDSQLTIRSDEDWVECCNKAAQAMRWLTGQGAQVPKRKPSTFNRNDGQKITACPTCGQVDQVEQISGIRRSDGQPFSAWKCQRCNKWMPKNFDPPKAAPSLANAAQAQKDIEELW